MGALIGLMGGYILRAKAGIAAARHSVRLSVRTSLRHTGRSVKTLQARITKSLPSTA